MTREQAIQHLLKFAEDNKYKSGEMGFLSGLINTALSNPWHKASEEQPTHFGDYLVITDSKQFGRRWSIKCWFGYPQDPFGDNPSREWVLEEDEKVSYWMEISDSPKEE